MTRGSRATVLSRVRAALSDVPADEATHPGPPPSAAPASGGGLPDLFAERVADYQATVTRCTADEVADAVSGICRTHRARRLVGPADLPSEWTPSGLQMQRDDPPLSLTALDEADGVITGAAAGIAETGTIVLDGGPGSGRRALTLVPDLHICVVRSTDLVATVGEMIGALDAAVRAGRAITLVSGPSATSDIEFERVEGVHGPRRLEVVLVDGLAGAG